ncbi:MAG: gamma-glutamyl-gamma-aminobutyrate hydrolase family protein [Myxococcota bacterium]|nr:gamma-glutamyl-gamma-aminobutyrate hydrolase family protein [Myxococcota bacterium]
MRLLIVNVNLEASTVAGCEAIAARLEELAPHAQIRHAHWADGHAERAAAAWSPRAVVLGPNGTPFPAYPETFDAFLRWLRTYQGALFGICGGHQVLALAHGGTVGPVFDVPPATETYEGLPGISGTCRVHITSPGHAALAGLPETITVAASHVDQVQVAPAGFRVIATGDPCPIQAMAHTSRPLLGVQFHPEKPTETDHGTTLLRSWLESLSST